MISVKILKCGKFRICKTLSVKKLIFERKVFDGIFENLDRLLGWCRVSPLA